jgi:hypothetical protein
MSTFADIEKIAETLYLRLKAGSKKQVDNVTNHFNSLTTSHGFTDKTQPAIPFWDALVNDPTFFEKANMPKKWGSESSYGHGVESMIKIMHEAKVRDALVTAWTEEGYKKALDECDKRRKSFLKNYKKVRRDVESPKPEEIIVEDDTVETEIIEEPSPIPSEAGDLQKITKKARKARVPPQSQPFQPQQQTSNKEASLEAEIKRMREHVEYVKKLLKRCMASNNNEVIAFGLETVMMELERI